MSIVFRMIRLRQIRAHLSNLRPRKKILEWRIKRLDLDPKQLSEELNKVAVETYEKNSRYRMSEA